MHLDHCFARILLDDACGQPRRECVRAPARKHAPPDVLGRALETGERVLDGTADLHAPNRRSLAPRGKASG